MASMAAPIMAIAPFQMLRISQPQLIIRTQDESVSIACAQCFPSKILIFPLQTCRNARRLSLRENHRPLAATCALSPGTETTHSVDLEDINGAMEGVSVTSTTTEAGKMKMKVDVSGARSEAIFDSVFSKLVSAAQPIPGFRRMKGGKTPNIPRDVLIQILGPTKVYKQVIKKVINSTVAEYVNKQKFKVSKDLKVEQSFEELEETFEPGEVFSFDVIIQLHEEEPSS